VLLPQPDGLERLVSVVPGSEVCDATVLDPQGVGSGELDGLAGGSAQHRDPNLGNDQVPCVGDLSRLHILDVHHVDVVGEAANYGVQTAIGPGVGQTGSSS
jgi:hypothetical protein